MGMCFVPDCRHYSERDLCSFFCFPQDEKEKKIWINNIRRADKSPTKYSKVCSCHFKDKLKANGPTIFERKKNKILAFDESPEKKKRKIRKDVIPTYSSRICSCHFVDHKKSNGPTIFAWNAPQKISPPSQKKYISITVDPTHCNPTQTSDIHGNRFVPILPRPIRTPISISHNAVPSQFNCLSAGNETGKIQNRDLQNKEQTTHKVMEPNDKIVLFEPEIILKIDNDVTLTCLEETEELDKTVNDPDNSSCNTNAKPLSSEEILKQKLEDMTTLYERTLKKLKLSQEQCKRYAKQIMSLEEVIDNLRQIISVSDFN